MSMNGRTVIDTLLDEGRGEFTCPSCGSLSSDVNAFPHCPRGCSEEDITRAQTETPPECPEARDFLHDSRKCLTCTRRIEWVRETVRAERGGPEVRVPETVNLADLLSEPEESTPYLVDQVWPSGGHVLLSAAAKVGKSTTRNNLVRSLVDGDPFLDAFEVPEPVERVVVLDLELNRATLRRWLGAQSITNASRVDVVPMRGQARVLDVLERKVRRRWAEQLKEADVVILDCLEPVLHALGLDANTEARKFLEEWGSMLTEAGVSASAVLHHHGHGSERAKGDSGILAWPDALWDMTQAQQIRYFTAHGRDVDVPEGRLDLIDDRLRYAGGAGRAADQGRAKARTDEKTLLEALREDHRRRLSEGEAPPGHGTSLRWPSQGDVESIGRSAGMTRDGVRAAITALCGSDLMVVSPTGRAGRRQHALTREGLGS